MKKFFKNRDNLIILFISLLAFIAGCLAKHALLSFLIVLCADAFLFLPEIMKTFKKENKNLKKSSKNSKQKTKKKRKIGKIILLILLFLIILVIIACVLFASYIVTTAPKFNPNELYTQDPTVVYAADGEVIAKLGAEKRETISYDDLPEVLIDAIVATEDSKFFQHHGFDLSRFVVASAKQVAFGGGGGASTLTMQVVKNTYTSTVSSGFAGIKRKFTDIYMSVFQVEKKYTKKEILEFYVNSYYLGSGAYGVEQASKNYFGKSAKDLNLAEAAMIAGLFQAPTAYDPYQNPEKAEQRRNQVLDLMLRHDYITKDEYNVATKIKVDDMLVKHDENGPTENEWQPFIDLVVEDVVDNIKLDPYKVSMKIYTTMDKDKQRYLNSVMSGENYNWQNDKVDAGISVQDVNTGAIVAIGAGRNRTGERQYNTATMISKQIGSTSKPLYDYAPGIEYENWSTYKLFVDEPYHYSDGTNIFNWDRGYNGLMTLRTAMAQSRNIPALKAFQENKNSNIMKFVQSVGLHPEIHDGIIHEAHAIGGYTGECPRDMAAAYASFGNGGYYIKPYSYTKVILNADQKEIKTEIQKTRVMSEETAYMMTSLLQSSAQTGLGNQSEIGGAVFGAKTGTSNFDAETIAKWGFGPDAVNDLWVDGVSPDYAISVWYGYKNRTEDNAKYYSTSYTIAHRTLFQAVARGIFKKGSNWTKPEGVKEVRIEFGTWPAALASEWTPENKVVTELFKAGTEPTESSSAYAKLPDVTGLKSTVSGNKLTLSWNAVTAKNSLNDLYKNGTAPALGDIVYKIYAKDGNGQLSHIKDVRETSTDIDLTTDSASTYVVRTAYSSFTGSMSDGVSTSISLEGVEAKIDISLANGDTTLNVGDSIAISNNDVLVKADSKNVTANASIDIKIVDSTNTPVTTIDTTKAGTYTITYAVTYKSGSKTLTRIITVKEV